VPGTVVAGAGALGSPSAAEPRRVVTDQAGPAITEHHLTTEADLVQPEVADPLGRKALTYKPALTGVRFIALLFMMLYHANISWARGGIFSIDVFFVLSGFLITSLLISEMTETNRIRLKHFWGRRAKRLLPALLFLLFGIAIYLALFATPEEAARSRGDGVSTLLYVSNWWYSLNGSSYFEAFQPSLFRHTWSLSIEEQFYVLWPLLFIGGYKVLKGRLDLMAAFVGLGALASAGLMFVLFDPDTDPSRLYYGTDTRAQALLIGVGLGLISHGNARRFLAERWIQIGGLLGYAVLAVVFATNDNRQPWIFHGGFLVFGLAAALIVFAHAGDASSPLNRIVGLPVLVWLGSVSYGAYLWQWPVFVVVDESRTGIGGLPLLALQFVLTFALAAVSYYVIETPIRRASFSFRGDARTYTVGVLGGAALVVLIFIVTSTVFGVDADKPAAAARAGAPRVLVAGDSTAFNLAVQYPGTGDLTVEQAVVLGCGVVRGENEPVDKRPTVKAECDSWPQKWEQREKEFSPDLMVIVTGTWEVFDKVVNGKLLKVGTEEWRAYARSEFEYALSLAGPGGRPVALLNAPCTRSLASAEGPAVSELNDATRLAHVNDLMAEIAAAHPDQVHLLDLEAKTCPNGEFETRIDGVEARPDGVHYSRAGTAVIWNWLAPQLQTILASSKTVPAK